MSTLNEVDESYLIDTATVSTAASEVSSKASDTSQPPLLDFIGNACEVSSWFSSCFPCAVVDINDGDDHVVNKLSRESAMHVMYSSQGLAGGESRGDTYVSASNSSGWENPVETFQLPREEETAHQTACSDASIHSAPHVIPRKDGEEEDEEVLDIIALDNDAGHLYLRPATPPKRLNNPGITDSQAPQPREESSFIEHKSSPKKKKRFGMKMFGRKNKA